MSNPHQIKDIRFFRAKSPISRPIADATHAISDIDFFMAEIETEAGITGQGYLLSFHYFPRAVSGALLDVSDFAKQFQVYETVRMAQVFAAESEYFGSNGLLKWIQALINVAMWDAWSKSLGQPIWKVLGGGCHAVPVYGSGGWLSYSDEELIDEVVRYRKRGFGAVKIKVGAKEPGRDIQRLRKVREVLGDKIRIMMDANQGMDLLSAIALAREAHGIGITWFEEPVVHTDFAGYETIRGKTGISLAMGEREFDLEPLKALIARNALDLWQPDLLRIGGVEQWRASAALAGAHHIPVLPHYYKDYDVPLLCTIPNGYGAESFDWIDGLIDNTMPIADGMAYPRPGNGWGFSFRHEKMKEFG
jgi:L-alanine-DL-glutamate epimerase-like enolase superfamily enzyme